MKSRTLSRAASQPPWQGGQEHEVEVGGKQTIHSKIFLLRNQPEITREEANRRAA